MHTYICTYVSRDQDSKVNNETLCYHHTFHDIKESRSKLVVEKDISGREQGQLGKLCLIKKGNFLRHKGK